MVRNQDHGLAEVGVAKGGFGDEKEPFAEFDRFRVETVGPGEWDR
jgi:hypothetical protein